MTTMMVWLHILFIAVVGAVPSAADPTVLVSGATGRTGRLVYQQLKDANVSTRALVRNITKARSLLNCGACSAAEGIYEGDVTSPATLSAAAFKGADVLVVATASSTSSIMANGSYPSTATPRLIDYEGTLNQVKLALTMGVKRVLYVSASGTSQPGNFLDMRGDPAGYVMMYHLEAEAYIMNAVLSVPGTSCTIVKPTGLRDTPRGHAKLLVFHNDGPHPCPSSTTGASCDSISRADVAAVLVEAATSSAGFASNTRFGLSSDPRTALPDTGTNWARLFAEARNVLGSCRSEDPTSCFPAEPTVGTAV